MKKLSIIAIVVVTVAVVQSCSDVKRNPSRVYMPDMAYSRAYETYADHSELKDSGIFYNARPVPGTVKRGDSMHYEILTDTTGGYIASLGMVNPMPVLDSVQKVESERLYLVNCGICHGPALDGNGPLYKDGAGPYSAKPANLSGSDAKIAGLSDGAMFFTITYGKNMMGSYASQVTPAQRWMIIDYIRSKQSAAKPAAAATDTTATAAKK
jgi:mono/diheme cytochrome c family protein